MSVDEDWTSAEDAQLKRLIKSGAGWDDIASTFLRSITDVQARAVHLARLESASIAATKAPAGQGTNGHGRTWEVITRGTCEICGREIHGEGPRRKYCGPEHAAEANRRKAADRYRASNDLPIPERPQLPPPAEAPPPAPKPAPAKETPVFRAPPTNLVRLNNDAPGEPVRRRARASVACSATSHDHTCILRSRHGSDHLTDNGIIFSRDGKDVWPDRNDVYLRMMLNKDMVAPQA